jgi:ribonuclease R
MMDKIGDDFTGVISAVTSFGFFVELNDIYVEGLVHISSLGQDFFHFDPLSHQLKGEHSNTRYRLGDTVKVKVARVDLDEKKMDFSLVGVTKKSGNSPRPASKKADVKPAKKSVKKPAFTKEVDKPAVAPAKKKRRKRTNKPKKPASES